MVPLTPCRAWPGPAPLLLLGSVFSAERGAVGTGPGSGPDQCPVGGMLGRDRRAVAAQSAGSGRLCSGPVLDTQPDPGRALAPEPVRAAGTRRPPLGPSFSGGSGRASVCRGPAESGVSGGDPWGNAPAPQNTVQHTHLTPHTLSTYTDHITNAFRTCMYSALKDIQNVE